MQRKRKLGFQAHAQCADHPAFEHSNELEQDLKKRKVTALPRARDAGHLKTGGASLAWHPFMQRLLSICQLDTRRASGGLLGVLMDAPEQSV